MSQARLKQLYDAVSKHSAYQVLAPEINRRFPELQVGQAIARYEEERFAAIKEIVPIQGKRILDIGGNTGYFSFELIANGAEHVTYVEGNRAHWEFVEEAVRTLGLTERITCSNEYFRFDKQLEDQFDVVVLLNVLHHVGDDYGEAGDLTIALEAMKSSLAVLAYKTRFLVLQIGFNWMGDVRRPLFQGGTKQAMLSWMNEVCDNDWSFTQVLVAERHQNSSVAYVPLNEDNSMRQDELGEFLNRPLVILESKKL